MPVVKPKSVMMIMAGTPGPPGPPGESIVEAYTRRVDFVGDELIYVGEALPGSLESDDVWRIKKVTIDTQGNVSITWADGAAEFAHIWDDRLQIQYS